MNANTHQIFVSRALIDEPFTVGRNLRSLARAFTCCAGGRRRAGVAFRRGHSRSRIHCIFFRNELHFESASEERGKAEERKSEYA